MVREARMEKGGRGGTRMEEQKREPEKVCIGFISFSFFISSKFNPRLPLTFNPRLPAYGSGNDLDFPPIPFLMSCLPFLTLAKVAC